MPFASSSSSLLNEVVPPLTATATSPPQKKTEAATAAASSKKPQRKKLLMSDLDWITNLYRLMQQLEQDEEAALLPGKQTAEQHLVDVVQLLPVASTALQIADGTPQTHTHT